MAQCSAPSTNPVLAPREVGRRPLPAKDREKAAVGVAAVCRSEMDQSNGRRSDSALGNRQGPSSLWGRPCHFSQRSLERDGRLCFLFVAFPHRTNRYPSSHHHHPVDAIHESVSPRYGLLAIDRLSQPAKPFVSPAPPGILPCPGGGACNWPLRVVVSFSRASPEPV